MSQTIHCLEIGVISAVWPVLLSTLCSLFVVARQVRCSPVHPVVIAKCTAVVVMTDRSDWPTLPSEDPTEERRWYRKYGNGEWKEYAPEWWMSAQEQEYWGAFEDQNPDAWTGAGDD